MSTPLSIYSLRASPFSDTCSSMKCATEQWTKLQADITKTVDIASQYLSGHDPMLIARLSPGDIKGKYERRHTIYLQCQQHLSSVKEIKEVYQQIIENRRVNPLDQQTNDVLTYLRCNLTDARSVILGKITEMENTLTIMQAWELQLQNTVKEFKRMFTTSPCFAGHYEAHNWFESPPEEGSLSTPADPLQSSFIFPPRSPSASDLQRATPNTPFPTPGAKKTSFVNLPQEFTKESR